MITVPEKNLVGIETPPVISRCQWWLALKLVRQKPKNYALL
jgi:hypothetical protein